MVPIALLDVPRGIQYHKRHFGIQIIGLQAFIRKKEKKVLIHTSKSNYIGNTV